MQSNTSIQLDGVNASSLVKREVFQFLNNLFSNKMQLKFQDDRTVTQNHPYFSQWLRRNAIYNNNNLRIATFLEKSNLSTLFWAFFLAAALRILCKFYFKVYSVLKKQINFMLAKLRIVKISQKFRCARGCVTDLTKYLPGMCNDLICILMR